MQALNKTYLEIINQVYSGINQNDVDTVINVLDTNISRLEFEGSPAFGTYHGHEELRQLIIRSRNNWAEGSCSPIDFFTLNNKVVVIVHVKVKLKNDIKWIDAQVADGFTITNNLITEFHSFTDREKAFKWAGLSQ